LILERIIETNQPIRLDHIVRLVRDGQNKRAPIERLADILTGHFVPVITLLAILTWLIWLSLGLSGVLPRNYLDKDVGGWRAFSHLFLRKSLMFL